MDPTSEQTPTPTPSAIHNRSDAMRDALAWDRVLLRNDLRLYIRQAWHVVETRTFILKTVNRPGRGAPRGEHTWADQAVPYQHAAKSIARKVFRKTLAKENELGGRFKS